MAWLSVAIAIIACLLLYGTGHLILLGLAILSVIGGIWSWGIMHNYATEAAKYRSSYKGKFYDFTEDEVVIVPDKLAAINMIFSIIGLVMMIIGIVIRLF